MVILYAMSEYIEIESEISDDGKQMAVYTNLILSDQAEESYDSAAAMEEGSPVVQALSIIKDIATLQIMEQQDMIITRQPDAEWHAIIADISAALKDFFL